MHIKLCQYDTTVGDLSGNTQKIIASICQEDTSAEPTVIVLPELAVSGYPPLDLLDNHNFIQEQADYVQKIVEATRGSNNIVILGYIEPNTGVGRNLYNSALVIHDGARIYNYRKRLLPTYDVFDEARYFEPGKEMGLFNFRGKRIGLVICEDLWYKNKFYTTNPAQELFNANADIIISINASPSIVGKYEQKIKMISEISATYNLPIFYCNQVGGNDDIVFDGNSFVVNECGGLVAHASRYSEDTLSVSYEETLTFFSGHYQNISPRYFESDAQFFYEQAIKGIQSYVNKCGFKGVVIGSSGGIDSALCIALAADALGKENVIGITMPSQYSSEGSYEDSEILCDNFGVQLYNYQIKSTFNTMLTQFNEIFPEANPGLAEENLQARIRGQLLMTYSNRYGYLVLSTGNKSELSVGFCTIHGDMAGGLAPISDLYKLEVFAVSKYVNKLHGKEMIPQAIIDKEPSAELAPNQRDVDSLPPYPILDPLLKFYIEGEVLSEEEYLRCRDIVKENAQDAGRVLKLINRAEFKRRQAAITIKMHPKAFGYGRRIPIAQKWVESV
jgi:NAD+ synthetase